MRVIYIIVIIAMTAMYLLHPARVVQGMKAHARWNVIVTEIVGIGYNPPTFFENNSP